jgi:hypothetical protein
VVDTLGVLAHRGGLLIERPELSVGVVRAVARPTGLELELLARRPLDTRSATQRQADIRAGRWIGPPPASRHLLPAHDEGTELRVGWLGADGRAHWAYGSYESSSGGAEQRGPSLRTVLRLPPLFDEVAIVLAWPEIGFPETVVRLPLPDRTTVDRDTESVWQAPVAGTPAGDSWRHGVADHTDEPEVEAGRVAAGPQVLARDRDAVVVLNRLTVIGPTVSIELVSLARDALANDIAAVTFPPRRETASRGPGAAVAVVRGDEALWLQPYEGTSSGGDQLFESRAAYAANRPDDGVLDLIVAWPAAGVRDVRVTVPNA